MIKCYEILIICLEQLQLSVIARSQQYVITDYIFTDLIKKKSIKPNFKQ